MSEEKVSVGDVAQLAIGQVMATMSSAYTTQALGAAQTATNSRDTMSQCFGKLGKAIVEHDLGEALGLNKMNNGMVDFAAQFGMGTALANASAVGTAQGAKVAYATVPSNEK